MNDDRRWTEAEKSKRFSESLQSDRDCQHARPSHGHSEVMQLAMQPSDFSAGTGETTVMSSDHDKLHAKIDRAEEEARQRRMLRNRESAARSREKRKQKNSALEQTIVKLRAKSEHVEALHSELTRLLGCMKAAWPETSKH